MKKCALASKRKRGGGAREPGCLSATAALSTTHLYTCCLMGPLCFPSCSLITRCHCSQTQSLRSFKKTVGQDTSCAFMAPRIPRNLKVSLKTADGNRSARKNLSNMAKNRGILLKCHGNYYSLFFCTFKSVNISRGVT